MSDHMVTARRKARKERRELELEYEIRDSGGASILRTFESATRDMIFAELVLAEQGYTITTERGARQHPLAAVLRSSREQRLTALKLLNLELPKGGR